MLNEERVVLMTKMASYEAHEGKKCLAIGSYFRNDYIGWQVLKSIISATIAFVVVFAMYIFYDFEIFMTEIYKMDLLEFAKNVLFLYLGTVGGVRTHLLWDICGQIQQGEQESACILYESAQALSHVQK